MKFSLYTPIFYVCCFIADSHGAHADFSVSTVRSGEELTLERAMDKAETFSRAIAIASQNVDINTSNKNAQILGMLPNISIQSQYLHPIDGINALTNAQVSSDVSIPTIGTSFTAGATLTQPIVGLYGLIMEMKQNSALLRSAIQNKNQTVQDERYFGAVSYINCTKSFQLIKVADAATEVAQKQLADAQAQFNEGLLTNADVLKFKLNLDNAKATRIQAETSHQIALINLAKIINEPNPDNIIFPQDYKSVMENKRATLGNINSIVEERIPLRYDVIASSENATAQGYAKYNTIGTYLPTLNFVTIFSRDFMANPITDKNGDVLFTKNELQDSLLIGAQLTWNILDWGVRQTQVNAASARQQIARLQLLEARDMARVEIKSTYRRLLDAYESLNIAKASVEYAENVYTQRQDQFQNGLISSTDLVLASDEQTNARARYVNAVGDLDVAWMAYFKATRQPLTTLN